MDEKGVPNLNLIISEEKSFDSLYPMFFGASCALFALRLLSEPKVNDERWSETRNRMLQGSAHLLGLLVWRVQKKDVNGRDELFHKLGIAEREIEELKRRRSEDAKANEKVVRIFASQEQNWFCERNKLRQQIGALLNELRVVERKRDEAITELNEKLQEKEVLVQSRDKALQEEEQKRREVEEKLKKSETVVEESRETVKREAQEHSSEIWKHKTAFIELVSNQRQLEAEMGRALRQVEAAKQEVDSVLEQKDEAVLVAQKLSMEIIKTRKDLEQKDKILSAMLRKSKLDTAEKQMLLKEMKLSKVKRKQAELETERWRTVSESRRERHSLRSMLSKHVSSKFESLEDGRGLHSDATVPSKIGRSRSKPTDTFVEYEQPEHRKNPLYDQYSLEAIDELTEVKQLEGWVRSEAEKYNNVIEQKHHLEIDAFAEQLRLKDEKLEAFRWRLLSMELESKRMQTHIEGLNHDLSQLKQDNMELKALILDREAELYSVKEEYALQLHSLNHLKPDICSCPHDPALAHDTLWSNVKIIKTKPGEKEHEMDIITEVISPEIKTWKEEEIPFPNQSKDTILTVQSPGNEFDDEKHVARHSGSFREECATKEVVDTDEKSATDSQSSSKKTTPWKMDLHALGVSYKIKRLKQQLVMLEKVTGKQQSCEDGETDDTTHFGIKGFHMLMSILNKQVSRYQSLQMKTDDLCRRMHETNLDVSCGVSSIAKTREETKTLEHFLEETFQLQRYMVATGQKLMEIHSRIASGLIGAAEVLEGTASFDMRRFADSVGTLFTQIQRGLEVRIARIIGDVEGTLACDGIKQLRKQ